MAYNNDNLAVAIHDTDNIITEENIEECVVDYWTQRVKDFSDVREHELNSDMGKEWLEEIISNISMYTAYDKKSGMSSGADVTENSRLKVLDVGTGVGYFAILLNRCGMDVTGIDLTPDMITRAKELADKYGADVTYEVMDAMELSYADETFDVVITRNLTWTLPDIQKAYKEWHRVLKKGGLLLNYDANYARMNSLEKTIIKDDDKTALYGVEMLFVAIMSLVLLYTCILHKDKFIAVANIVACIGVLYYLVKSISIYIREKLKWKKTISDVKEIVAEE